MKYALVHCYTDKNKGDAAIIIATSQLIKEIDPQADISFISTYGAKDVRVDTEHKLIASYGNRTLPSIFGEPQSLLGIKSDKLRIVAFLVDLIKSMLLLISANCLFMKIFLNKKERESFIFFSSADVIIAKGGSYLYTENTSLRQSFSLIRMLYPFILAKRYGKKIVIFSQSLGPIEGKFNKWIFKRVLLKVDKVYLREKLCLDKYDVVKDICQNDKCRTIPDSAFFLKYDKEEDLPVDIDMAKYNVGYTIVDHDFKYIKDKKDTERKNEQYKNSLIESMKHCIDNYNAIIHIFPQVSVIDPYTGHSDARVAKEIINHFKGTVYERFIHFYELDLNPTQLLLLYSKMQFLIGTRLHSVIFALSTETPAINISYHGTKSKGILRDIGAFDQYVIDINTIEFNILMIKIKDLIDNKEVIKQQLKLNIPEIKEKLRKAMKEVCTM